MNRDLLPSHVEGLKSSLIKKVLNLCQMARYICEVDALFLLNNNLSMIRYMAVLEIRAELLEVLDVPADLKHL